MWMETGNLRLQRPRRHSSLAAIPSFTNLPMGHPPLRLLSAPALRSQSRFLATLAPLDVKLLTGFPGERRDQTSKVFGK